MERKRTLRSLVIVKVTSYDSFRVIYHCTLSLTDRKALTTFPSNSWTENAKLLCSSIEYVTFS